MSVQYRLATLADGLALDALIRLSTLALQSAYYTPVQLEGALRTVFGVDSQLIKDGTYYVATEGDVIIGCGGWSKRKTLYGGDAGRAGEDSLRDPETESAMIRAFFVNPEHVRRGIARQLLQRCEAAAAAAGFLSLEIIATLAGEPLYAACGYGVVERLDIELGNGALLPVVRMRRNTLSGKDPAPKLEL